MTRLADPEAQAALDAWADNVAALEPAVSRAFTAYAGRLAANRRLPKDDRRFAAAQADAVRRALRRRRAKRPKRPKRGSRQ